MQQPSETQLPATALAILGLLSRYPQSGYDLKQSADRSIRHFYWSPAKSQVYGELRRLRQLGLVEESFVRQEKRPDRRVYTLTGAGRSTLGRWLNDPVFEPTVFKSSMLLKIFFGAYADSSQLAVQLESAIAHDREFIARLEEAERECEAEGDDAIFSLLTVRAGLAHGRADIQWAEEARDALLKINRKRSVRN